MKGRRAHNGNDGGGNAESLVASSLGVDDALLRKLVDVVDVEHTKKGLKPKRKCQNEPRKRKFSENLGPGGSTA